MKRCDSKRMNIDNVEHRQGRIDCYGTSKGDEAFR